MKEFYLKQDLFYFKKNNSLMTSDDVQKIMSLFNSHLDIIRSENIDKSQYTNINKLYDLKIGDKLMLIKKANYHKRAEVGDLFIIIHIDQWHRYIMKHIKKGFKTNFSPNNKYGYYAGLPNDNGGKIIKITNKINDIYLPIEDLDISQRTYNILNAAKINIIKDVLTMDFKSFMRYRNAGKKSWDDLQKCLIQSGLIEQ